MTLGARAWFVAALIGVGAFPAATARGADWKVEHDAGWDAYKEGRLDEAERRLKEAEKEARKFGEQDTRLATTLDHLAWVYCSEGRPEEAVPLATDWDRLTVFFDYAPAIRRAVYTTNAIES